jgi:hypothetical protein
MWTWRRGPAAQERASGWPAALALFAAAFVLGVLFYSRHPLLYDADSYYHLTIARAFAQDGLLHSLPWARFSVMHQGFGDKEFLFHVLLAPFAAMADPLAGGRLALALLDALVLASLGYLASRAVGPWGLLVPFGLVAGSGEVAWRLVRLRSRSPSSWPPSGPWSAGATGGWGSWRRSTP